MLEPAKSGIDRAGRMTGDFDDFESVAVASSDRLEDERRRERHAHDYVDNVLRGPPSIEGR